MRWRPFHLGFILFQAFWLNVVVPGHTRGSVLLPGSRSAPCCCCGDAAEHRKGQAPTPYEREHCAICSFAAHLMLPPPVDFSLAPLGLCELLPVVQPATAHSASFLRLDHCRGPPVFLPA